MDIRVFLTKGQPPLSSTDPECQTNFEPADLNPFEDQNPFADGPNSFYKAEDVISRPSWMKVTSGRPDLEQIISEEINVASGKVSISGRHASLVHFSGHSSSLIPQVCGPSAMANVVRETLRLPWSSPSSPLNGGPSVTLYVECFGYA